MLGSVKILDDEEGASPGKKHLSASRSRKECDHFNNTTANESVQEARGSKDRKDLNPKGPSEVKLRAVSYTHLTLPTTPYV